MELIIEFYKSLDTLNLVIFWGIIIVIFLLIIFSIMLLNKNKKLKHIVENKEKENEELPIITQKIEQKEEQKIIQIEKEETETIEKQDIEKESKFIAEEHVIEYNKEIQENDNKKDFRYQEIEIPTKPYQRNILKEMSLSQTSPIGITTKKDKEDRKIEMAKELYDALSDNKKQNEKLHENEIIIKELRKVEMPIKRKTEVKDNIQKKQISTIQNKEEITKENLEKKLSKEEKNTKTTELSNDTRKYFQMDKINKENIKEEKVSINEELIEAPVKELLNSVETKEIKTNNKTSSEIYLEEVSKKLAEADLKDEIERTDYELEQEEIAIISYKELMEKKDSIQTIDEEEAVISIEELMNRNKKEQQKEDTKLYNITEEEENDNFIKELKQFRKDL